MEGLGGTRPNLVADPRHFGLVVVLALSAGISGLAAEAARLASLTTLYRIHLHGGR